MYIQILFHSHEITICGKALAQLCNSSDSPLGDSVAWRMHGRCPKCLRHPAHLWKMTNVLLDESHQSKNFHPQDSIRSKKKATDRNTGKTSHNIAYESISVDSIALKTNKEKLFGI